MLLCIYHVLHGGVRAGESFQVAVQAATKQAVLVKQAGKAGDLQALNDQLLHNQQAFQQRVKAAEQRADAAELECKELKEQVQQTWHPFPRTLILLFCFFSPLKIADCSSELFRVATSCLPNHLQPHDKILDGTNVFLCSQ